MDNGIIVIIILLTSTNSLAIPAQICNSNAWMENSKLDNFSNRDQVVNLESTLNFQKIEADEYMGLYRIGKLCNYGKFSCDGICNTSFTKCNNKTDNCVDGNDKEDCKGDSTFQVSDIAIATTLGVTKYDELQLKWWNDVILPKNVEYLPSLCDYESKTCVNVTNWIKETSYNLTNGINILPNWKYFIKIFIRVGDKEYPPGIEKYFRTSEAEPEPPFNLRVVQITHDQVNVSWQRPNYINGYFKGYKIQTYPLITIPPLIFGQWAVINIPPKVLNVTFWVRIVVSNSAPNIRNESVNSAALIYYMKPICKFRIVPHSLDVHDRRFTLCWTTVGRCTHFKVELISSTYHNLSVGVFNEKSREDLSSKYLYLVDKLNPATNYTVIITMLRDGIPGLPNSLTISTTGRTLNAVGQLTGTCTSSRSIRLQWFHYDDHKHFIVLFWKDGGKPQEIQVNGQHYDFNHLNSCTKYNFDVYKLDPTSGFMGSPTNRAISMVTGIDRKAPPQNVKAIFNPCSPMELNVVWDAPCGFKNETLNYTVAYRETTKGKQSWINVDVVGGIMHFKLPTNYGVSYEVKIRTCVEGSRYSLLMLCRSAEIPVLESIQQEDDPNINNVTIKFTPSILPPLVVARGIPRYFAILSTSKYFMDSKKTWTFQIEPNRTEFHFNRSLFGKDTTYYAAVKLIDGAGYSSPHSDYVILDTSKFYI